MNDLGSVNLDVLHHSIEPGWVHKWQPWGSLCHFSFFCTVRKGLITGSYFRACLGSAHPFQKSPPALMSCSLPRLPEDFQLQMQVFPTVLWSCIIISIKSVLGEHLFYIENKPGINGKVAQHTWRWWDTFVNGGDRFASTLLLSVIYIYIHLTFRALSKRLHCPPCWCLKLSMAFEKYKCTAKCTL